MIAWLVWFFGAVPLLVLDGWLVRVVCPVPVLTLAVCLFLVLFARPGALPGLLLCVALARAVLLGGDLALHVLALGLPVAVLVPLRVLFFRRHLFAQAAAVAVLAAGIPALAGLLGRLVDGPVAALSWRGVGWAVLLVPPATWLLRRLPPLCWFAEVGE